jgi:hypothetical protein
MATVTNNVLVDGMSGKFGRSLVFRTMRGKTFVSALARKPNKKKESEVQRNTRITFKQAAEWAQNVLLDAEKKAYYKQRAKALKLPNAYTAAITDYMRKPKIVKMQDRSVVTYRISKPGFVLKEVNVAFPDTTAVQPRVFTKKQNDVWLVWYTPDQDELSFTLMITDNALREHRFATGRSHSQDKKSLFNDLDIQY